MTVTFIVIVIFYAVIILTNPHYNDKIYCNGDFIKIWKGNKNVKKIKCNHFVCNFVLYAFERTGKRRL